MLKKIVVATALLAGCMAEVQTPIPPEYGRCLEYRAWEPEFCTTYYYWVPSTYSVYGYWRPGHWEPRPGYRTPTVRDHRR